MIKTFKNQEHCILPSFYDDIIIKGRDFNEHLNNNTRTILDDIKNANFTLNVHFFKQKSIIWDVCYC